MNRAALHAADAPPPARPGFVDIAQQGVVVTIEYAWIAPARTDAPLLVFLHEGLGSLAMWRDWPARVCDAAACRGLVYSRPGYGRSTARRHDDPWPPSFMQTQADAVLPALLDALQVSARDPRYFLVGHSDGGSIALIHAATFPERVAGVVAIAPHIMVEDVSLASIARARDAYRDGDLGERLARYHDDVESAFGGWCGAWLAPGFRDWSIEDMLARLRCPLLAMQGDSDEYGTLAQVEGIRTRAAQATIEVLRGCGHSPQRDKPGETAAMIARFIATTARRQGGVKS